MSLSSKGLICLVSISGYTNWVGCKYWTSAKFDGSLWNTFQLTCSMLEFWVSCLFGSMIQQMNAYGHQRVRLRACQLQILVKIMPERLLYRYQVERCFKEVGEEVCQWCISCEGELCHPLDQLALDIFSSVIVSCSEYRPLVSGTEGHRHYVESRLHDKGCWWDSHLCCACFYVFRAQLRKTK